MSVPPPPPPRKFVSSKTPPTTASPPAALKETEAKPAAISSSSVSFATVDASDTPRLAALPSTPTPVASIMKKSSATPVAQPSKTRSRGLSVYQTNAADDEVVRLRVAVEELTRENKLLQTRVANFVSSTSASCPTVGETGSSGSGALDESSSPALLIARIQSLEKALQLECLERDDCETKASVQQRLIAHLLDQLSNSK